MGDLKDWRELTQEEKELAVEKFMDHELEEFDDVYTEEEAVEVLRSENLFWPEYKRGGLVDIEII